MPARTISLVRMSMSKEVWMSERVVPSLYMASAFFLPFMAGDTPSPPSSSSPSSASAAAHRQKRRSVMRRHARCAPRPPPRALEGCCAVSTLAWPHGSGCRSASGPCSVQQLTLGAAAERRERQALGARVRASLPALPCGQLGHGLRDSTSEQQ